MKTLFLSFSSRDIDIVNLIEQKLKEILGNQINISRYEREVMYRDSFKAFMDSLSKHDFVLSIVSDSYLKSEACLYEVGEVLKNSEYAEKLFFVILSEEDRIFYPQGYESIIEANIYSRENRVKYLEYWNQKNEKDKSLLEKLDPVIARKEFDQYFLQLKVSQFDLPVFLDYLRDAKSIPLQQLLHNNFVDVVSQMFPDYLVDGDKYSDITELLDDYIRKIVMITGTDYNQIILKGKTSSHSSGYLVVAANIASGKQNYRYVINGGCITKSIDENELILVRNIIESPLYFQAVYRTKSEIVVPISFGNTVLGAINSESESVDYYTNETVTELTQLADRLAALLHNIGYTVDAEESELPFVLIK